MRAPFATRHSVLLVVGGLACTAFAATPRAHIGPRPVSLDQRLDARAVNTLVFTHVDQLHACYAAALEAAPATSGVLVLHWDVKDDGSVTGLCQSTGTTTPTALGRCVSDAIATWTFPSPGFAHHANVEYAFDFAP